MSDTMAEKVYCYEPMNCKDNSALWAALMNKDNSAEYAMMNSWNNNPLTF